MGAKMKLTLPIFSDTFLSGFITFFISRIFLRYITAKSVAINVLSAALAVCVSLLVYTVLSKNSNKKSSRIKEQKRLDFILSELELTDDNRLIALFLPLFRKSKIPFEIYDDRIETENFVFFFDYSFSTERKTVVNVIKKSDGKKAVLFCNTLSNDCAALCEANKERILIADKTVLLRLEKYGLNLPQPPEKQKSRFIPYVKQSIISLSTIKHARALAFSGAAILLFSRISFYPLWYRICGGTLLFISAFFIAIRIAKRNSTVNDSVISALHLTE